MSGPTGGNFQQTHHDYDYDDGRGSVRVRSYSMRWTSSQPNMPTPVQPPNPPMAITQVSSAHLQHTRLPHMQMPPALSFDERIHQTARVRHQAIVQQTQQGEGKILRSLFHTGHVSDSDSSYSDRSYSDSSSEEEYERFQELEESHLETRRAMDREAAKIHERMARLEERDARSRQDSEAKDREMEALRRQNEQLQQQQLEAEKRHSREISEIAKSRASSSAAISQPATGIDADVLQKIIAEVRSDKLSKQDIKELIEDAVGKQLAGVARTSDLESSASRMETALHRLPSGASESQVQKAIRQELDSAVKKAARHMSAQRKRLEARPPQEEQRKSLHVQTEFIIEDLDTEPSSSSSKRRASVRPATDKAIERVKHSDNRHSSGSKRSTLSVESSASKGKKSSTVSAVPPMTNTIVEAGPSDIQQSLATRQTSVAMPPARVKGKANVIPPEQNSLMRLNSKNPESGVSSNKASKSRASVPPGANNLVARVGHSDKKSSRSSNKSTVSVQPSASNALSRHRRNDPQQNRDSADAMTVARSRRGGIAQNDEKKPSANLQDEHPDQAIQRLSLRKQSVVNQPLIDKNTVARVQPKNDRRADPKSHGPGGPVPQSRLPTLSQRREVAKR